VLPSGLAAAPLARAPARAGAAPSAARRARAVRRRPARAGAPFPAPAAAGKDRARAHARIRRLVCTGALTNAALLLILYPELRPGLEIVIMARRGKPRPLNPEP
jgi:inosine-uridine nucleoside N-ribohydrolase